jgi:hypothetical protein
MGENEKKRKKEVGHFKNKMPVDFGEKKFCLILFPPDTLEIFCQLFMFQRVGKGGVYQMM